MSSFSLHQSLVRLIVRIGWAALLLLALAACGFDAPPPADPLCREWGGRIEHRPLLDGSDLTIEYCVFADGTECHIRQFYYGTCTPPGANAPLSPIPTPIGGFGAPLGSGFDYTGPAPSLAALVDHAPLILIGMIGSVQQHLEVGGYYGEDGQLEFPGTDDEGKPLPGTPVTDFLLHVEEVLRDDGTIAGGQPVILRVVGYITEELKQTSQAGEFPAGYTGDRYLFLLSPYPDGETYGFYYGPWSRLIVDGDILRISNGKQQPLQFGEDAPVTLDEFLAAAQGE